MSVLPDPKAWPGVNSAGTRPKTGLTRCPGQNPAGFAGAALLRDGNTQSPKIKSRDSRHPGYGAGRGCFSPPGAKPSPGTEVEQIWAPLWLWKNGAFLDQLHQLTKQLTSHAVFLTESHRWRWDHITESSIPGNQTTRRNFVLE